MELKEVKSKIGSVKNISELTSSLETFSALKMKKTQKRFLESAPFSKEMARMLKNMENSLRENRSIFLEERNVKMFWFVLLHLIEVFVALSILMLLNWPIKKLQN